MDGLAPRSGGGKPDGGSRGGSPERIDAILQRVSKEFRPAKRRAGLADLWRRVAGEELAAETQAVAVRRGELIVEARSAALVHELQGFRREALLERLIAADTRSPRGSRAGGAASGGAAGKGARVTGLRFRLGVF